MWTFNNIIVMVTIVWLFAIATQITVKTKFQLLLFKILPVTIGIMNVVLLVNMLKGT